METTMFSFQTVGVFTGGTLDHRLRLGPPFLRVGMSSPRSHQGQQRERSLSTSQHRDRKSNLALLPVGGWAGAAVGDTCVIVMASNHDECVRPDIPLMEFVREFLLYDRKKARLARLQYCIITPIFMHAHCMMVCDVGLRINLVLFCQEDSLAIRRISFSCSEKRQCATLGVC